MPRLSGVMLKHFKGELCINLNIMKIKLENGAGV